MKKKLLSLLLVVAILVTTVSMGFGSVVSTAAAAGGGAEAINAFSLTAGDITSGSGGTTVTVKSKLDGYKIRINSITATIIFYQDTTSVLTGKITVSVNSGAICDTNGSSFNANASGVTQSGLVRYECKYDLLKADGTEEYTGLTGYGYGAIAPNGDQTGQTGSGCGNLPTADRYSINRFDQLASWYVQVATLELQYALKTEWDFWSGKKSVTVTFSKTSGAPSSLTLSNAKWTNIDGGVHNGSDDKVETGSWLTMSTPASGYYNFTVSYSCSNGMSNSGTFSATEMYYRADGDKTTASNTATTYLNKNLEKSYYTEATWNNYLAALDNAMLVARMVPGNNYAYKTACQNAANTSALSTALSSAESNLVQAPADYTAFNNAVSAFTTKKNATAKVYTYATGATTWGETTTSLYDETAENTLQTYINGVNRSYKKCDQKLLDSATTKITKDTNSLPHANAVYTYFDIAEAEFHTYDGKGYIYTEETWNNFTTMCGQAFDSSRKNLTADKQSDVNLSINQFIDAREYLDKKPADTSALVSALDEGDVIKTQKENNELITTADGFDAAWTAFEEAYNVAYKLRNVKIDEQAAVDAAAADLAAAVNRLAGYRPLDTTLLQAAIRKRPTYSPDKYVLESRTVWQNLVAEGEAFVDAAEDGIKTYKDYDEMVRLTNMINEAYNGLELVKADFTALNAAVAKIPPEEELNLYKDEYVKAVKDLYSLIDYGATFEEQDKVDDLAASIEATVAALTEENLKPADYTGVEAAIAEFNNIDKTIRTEDSLNAVEAAIDAVVEGKNIKQQADVDAMEAAIREAIANLKYIGADYSDVERAIADAEAVENKDDYGNYDRVQAAIDAVDWTLTIDKQAEVNAYAAAIDEAVKNLVLAEANYSGVRDAIAEAEALGDLSDFTDESVEALDLAISKVVAGYTKDRQDEVDAMEAEIRAALDKMELLPADYSEAKAAIKYAQSFNKDDYSNYADVQTAIDAVDWTLNCRQYDILNAQIQAINTAVANLKLLPADYEALNTKIEEARYAYANGPYPYTEESIQAVENVISGIKWDYDIKHQANVDAYIPLIDAAVANLKYVRADYTGYDDMMAKYNEKKAQNLYVGLDTVYSNILLIPTDITIDKQSELDAKVAEINNQLDNLEYANADYSLVNSSVERYNAINRDYYNEGDLIPVDTAYRSIVLGLKANEQARVTEMGKNLSDALDTLATKMKDADLTKLNEAVEAGRAKYAEMFGTGYKIESTSENALFASIGEADKFQNSKINEQEAIDALTAQIIADTANLEYVFQIITAETTAIIDGNYIYGFEEGTMSKQAAEMIKFVGPAEIQFVETRNGFGTGTVIQFVSTKDGSILAAYTVIVFGDANGDSVIDMFDVAYMCEIISTFETPSDVVRRAIDLDPSGFIDATDLTIMTSLANMDATLKQDGSMETFE